MTKPSAKYGLNTIKAYLEKQFEQSEGLDESDPKFHGTSEKVGRASKLERDRVARLKAPKKLP